MALVQSLRLAAIVESSQDSIFSQDLNGVVSSWNKGAECIFGYKAEEIIGRLSTLIIPAELQDEEPVILCAKLCRKNGNDLEQIKVLLGHSLIQTTERYLESEQDIEIAVNDNLGL